MDMFERLKRLYREEHRITKEQLLKAVEKGWITKEQYEEIISE